MPKKHSKGRDTNGRFTNGNSGGPGNPHAARVGALREAFLGAVTNDDLRAVVRKLVARAKGGDIAAARELLDRVLGKSVASVAVAVENGADGIANKFLTRQQMYEELVKRRLVQSQDHARCE